MNPYTFRTTQHLIAKGKLTMVAMVACMRKLLTCLNAMVRDNTPWNDTLVTVFFKTA